EDGARLDVVSLQDWDRDSVHVSHQYTKVGRDAGYRSVVVTLGGDLVRLSPKVGYTGPGGNAELYGLYFTGEGQHHEHRSLVDHNLSHTRSRVDYKGALSGEDAHAVWIGDVIIGEGTKGTDSYENNRNLVLTDGTRVDSVPNLEIFSGEVEGAGHASTSGRLDDIHLFYLQSRGIPADEARRLVIRGFFAEIINRIEVPELRQRITDEVEEKLAFHE
ncbi:MAG TPA: SufD family Fe-S cluster assembly protein, partial [Ornithinicoccus sp.]|nr:SufD family Fe-S cluster assembly protein [Ornithinicoccus sp.]